MARILIIDDDKKICETLSQVMERMGHAAKYALRLEDGLSSCAQEKFDIVFLDVRLPDGNGLEALPEVQKSTGLPEVIIITGEGDPDGAELAIKNGAWDYIEKPLSLETITLPLLRALQFHDEKQTNITVDALNREGIIGNSSQISNCLNLVAQAAGGDANTLIIGETGTGKELFAKAIHQNSRRCQKNFVVVDCAALPETLVESTLFGHKKGAFTGADKERSGLVKMADGGTLFLDEIGELPLAIQRTFLRVLQEKRFRPVGGSREEKSDFRLVAATNRNLDRMVEEASFRQDLLFRLRSLSINLPLLKDRHEDIETLAMHFLNYLSKRSGTNTKSFSKELLSSFLLYDWPGNVRELISVLESILSAAGDSTVLYPDHLPLYIRAGLAKSSVRTKEKTKKHIASSPNSPDQNFGTFREFRKQVIHGAEKRYLENLMSCTSWSIKEACKLSGLSRPRLYALLKKHQIRR